MKLRLGGSCDIRAPSCYRGNPESKEHASQSADCSGNYSFVQLASHPNGQTSANLRSAGTPVGANLT
jgi:hypothetical protein